MVSLVIPFRGGQRNRERAMKYTREELVSRVEPSEVIEHDSGHDPFNRAASRNGGVERAKSDVVVVCDADTVPERLAVHEAISQCDDGKLHLPFTHFLSLNAEHTEGVVRQGKGLRTQKPEFTVTSAVGGCFVMRRDAYLSVRQDEKFEGWGGEDVAFKYSCDALLGPTVRHEGKMFGLWHPTGMDAESEQYKQNIRRQNLFKASRRDPEGIKALLRD